MANEINRVYQFLAKFNKNGKDWIDEADTNKDGFVIKSEFRTLMEGFDWNGETSQDSKNDLINQFWKTIDTNKSTSKIGASKIRNANALDNKEVAAMEYRITGYEILNKYIENLKCPAGIKDKVTWKQKINESLLNKVEEYLETEKPVEELQAYLEEVGAGVQNMATADMFADQYLYSNEMKNLLKQYDFVYDKDTELYEIISNYVNNVPKDATAQSIQETVIKIVDAYLATAGIKENSGNIDLSEYGYEANQYSALNEIQKAVLKKQITDNLSAIKKEANYEKYKDIYDDAINNFIENKLEGASYNDFETLKKIGIDEFKNDESYKNISKMAVVSDILNADDLKQAISEAVTETFANKIGNAMEGEIPVYDEIVNEATQKAIDGEFDTNGQIDKAKVKQWIIEEIKTRLTEFYPNNLEGVEFDELNPTYDALVHSAKAQNNSDKHKEIAISYCTIVSAKSTSLANAVNEIFGDYKTSIKNLTTNEIDKKMLELKAKVQEIGDISTYVVSNWGDLPSDVTLAMNATKNYALNATVSSKNGAIDTARITYAVDGVKTNNNVLTLKGESTNGTKSVKVDIYVDDVKIGTKTISVKTLESQFNWSNINTRYNGYINTGEDELTPNGNKTLSELYSSNGVINLTGSADLYRANAADNFNQLTGGGAKEAVNRAKSGLANFVDFIVNAAKETGSYNTEALSKAAERVKSLYNAAFTHSLNNWAGKKSTKDNVVSYDGENYNYQVAKYWSNNSTMDVEYSKKSSAANNDLGLRIGEQYDDGWYQIVVNSKCVMDLFNRFYEQALMS